MENEKMQSFLSKKIFNDFTSKIATLAYRVNYKLRPYEKIKIGDYYDMCYITQALNAINIPELDRTVLDQYYNQNHSVNYIKDIYKLDIQTIDDILNKTTERIIRYIHRKKWKQGLLHDVNRYLEKPLDDTYIEYIVSQMDEIPNERQRLAVKLYYEKGYTYQKVGTLISPDPASVKAGCTTNGYISCSSAANLVKRGILTIARHVKRIEDEDSINILKLNTRTMRILHDHQITKIAQLYEYNASTILKKWEGCGIRTIEHINACLANAGYPEITA